MRFAKVIFLIAGIWGFLIVTPLFFLHEYVGQQYPPAVTHPDFYYGFIAVTLVWQAAFLIISRDPVRLRPIMIAAMLEKFGYVATLTVLFVQGLIVLGQYFVVIPDFILGLLFVEAYRRTAG